MSTYNTQIHDFHLYIMINDTSLIIKLYLRQPIYTMTIINEHVFATGDDDGVVKCNNNY